MVYPAKIGRFNAEFEAANTKFTPQLNQLGVIMCSEFEQALRTALSRNPMNSYERALAFLEMIKMFPDRNETIMRAFYPIDPLSHPAQDFRAVT